MTEGAPAAGAAAPAGTSAAPQTPAGGAPAGGAAPAAPAGGGTPPAGQTPLAGGQQTPPAQGSEGGQPATPPASPATPEFKIPDAYKDKGWASKVKSLDDLFQQIDTLDAMKGKKTVVPDLSKATPEEREQYYAQTRPKEATAYQIPADVNGFPISDATKAGVQKIFFENGISEVQGNAVIQAYNELGKAQVAEMFSPEGTKTSLQEAFGDNWETVTRQTRNSIKGMMSEADQQALDTMPNKYLGVLYRTLGATIQHFGVKPSDINAHVNGGTGSAAGGSNSVESQRAAIRQQIANLANQPHEAGQAQALRQKLADTYKNDPRLQGAG